MFEDMLRAARKANGEEFGKARNYPPPKPPPKYDAPKKWYEKKWGVALALIVCFPVGVILLWQNPRYSNAVKGGITALFIFSFLFYRYSTYESPSRSVQSQKAVYTQEVSSDVGYLSKGVLWIDDSGRERINSRRVKVEITGNSVVMADGSRCKQIYFLEGSNAGSWGYVNSNSISR